MGQLNGNGPPVRLYLINQTDGKLDHHQSVLIEWRQVATGREVVVGGGALGRRSPPQHPPRFSHAAFTSLALAQSPCIHCCWCYCKQDSSSIPPGVPGPGLLVPASPIVNTKSLQTWMGLACPCRALRLLYLLGIPPRCCSMLDTLGSWVGITCTAEQQKNLKSRVDFTIHEQFIIFF